MKCYPAAVEQANVFYVGKHGKSENDGRTIDSAFPTFTEALAAAAAEVPPPSWANSYSIECVDGGLYTESFTIPSYVYVEAEAATIVGLVTMHGAASLRVNHIEGTAGAIKRVSTNSTMSYVRANTCIVPGGATQPAIQASGGVLSVELTQGWLEDNHPLFQLNWGHLFLECDELMAIDGTAPLVRVSDGKLYGQIELCWADECDPAVVFADGADADVHLIMTDCYCPGYSCVMATGEAVVKVEANHLEGAIGLRVEEDAQISAQVSYLQGYTYAYSAQHNGRLDLTASLVSGNDSIASSATVNAQIASSNKLLTCPEDNSKSGEWIAMGRDPFDFGWQATPTEDLIVYMRTWLQAGTNLTSFLMELTSGATGNGATTWVGLYSQTNPATTDWTLAAGKPDTRVAYCAAGGAVVQTPAGLKTINLASAYTIPNSGYYWFAIKSNWTGIGGVAPSWLSALHFYGASRRPLFTQAYSTSGLPATATPATPSGAQTCIYQVGKE